MIKQTFFALALGVVAVAAAAPAGAQTASPAPGGTTAPAVSPSPAKPLVTPTGAPSATPAASPSEPPKFIQLSGFGDGGFTAVNGTDAARFTTGVPSRIFDAATGPFFDANGGRLLARPNDFNNTLDLQNANVQLTLTGPVVSAKFEGSLGTDADVIASNGQSRGGVNLTYAYLQFARGPVTVLAGKFATLAGAEVIESPNDSNYSRSYLFGEAVPFTHTGVRVTYAATPKVSVIAGVNNGWDDWKFDGKKKTLEGGLAINPSPGYSLTLQTYNGNDFALGGQGGANLTPYPPLYTNRMLYDGVLTVHPTGALTLIANYDNGTQLSGSQNVGAQAPLAFSTQHWNGIAGYANYQFTPKYGISLRKETFHDVTGFRTGIAQRLQSNTATLGYTPNNNYIFRAEYRLDTTDANSFTYRGYVPTIGAPFDGRPHQSSIGVETIVKFP